MSDQIRKASVEDAAAIGACMRDCFAGYIPLIQKEPQPMTLNYSDIIREQSVYVLEVGGEIAGAVTLEDGADGFVWLDVLGVFTKHQGKGYGKKLIAFAESIVRGRGASEIRLYTNIKFEATIELYKRLGYEVYDRRVEKGYDRLYFRKEL
ncbi:MAG: GNAT family N-acetyltransferase [Oscillospiraceae bacterium]|nr:GNAT family N-acetyltransferase [Oscillospiraceae bacterium]